MSQECTNMAQTCLKFDHPWSKSQKRQRKMHFLKSAFATQKTTCPSPTAEKKACPNLTTQMPKTGTSKFDHPLERISNKNDQKLSKPTFLHLSDLILHGTYFSIVTIVLYTQSPYAKDHLPKSNRRENIPPREASRLEHVCAKAARICPKWTNMAAKQCWHNWGQNHPDQIYLFCTQA